MCVVASSSRTKLNAFPFLSYMLYMGFHFFFFTVAPESIGKKLFQLIAAATPTQATLTGNNDNVDVDDGNDDDDNIQRKCFTVKCLSDDKRDRQAENFWRGSGKWSQKLYDDIMGRRDRSRNVLVICKWNRLNFVYDMMLKANC